MSDLRNLLDNLINQAMLDADEGCEEYSPATNSIRNAIIERYGHPVTTYVAMIDDRHTDAEPYVFTTEAKAVAFARTWAVEHASNPIDFDEPDCPKGWLYYADYSTEGDCVWVIEKRIDSEQGE